MALPHEPSHPGDQSAGATEVVAGCVEGPGGLEDFDHLSVASDLVILCLTRKEI